MKKDSKGYKSTWVGYKLHLEVADGQIPISCLLTSASGMSRTLLVLS